MTPEVKADTFNRGVPSLQPVRLQLDPSRDGKIAAPLVSLLHLGILILAEFFPFSPYAVYWNCPHELLTVMLLSGMSSSTFLQLLLKWHAFKDSLSVCPAAFPSLFPSLLSVFPSAKPCVLATIFTISNHLNNFAVRLLQIWELSLREVT